MGDLTSPGKRAVADRLRQRYQQYRRQCENASSRLSFAAPTLYESQQQETLLLSQRWQESKANKKSSKSSTRTNRDSNSNQQIQQRLKRKLENNTSTEGGNPDHYKFDDPLSPPSKTQCTQQPQNNNSQQTGYNDPQTHCVSVNIVQQINNAPQSNINSEIKINVQSTVHTSQCSNASTSTEIKTSTNICKEEPKDPGSVPPNQSGNSAANPASQGSDSIGLEDVNELEKILEDLEREEGAISADFIHSIDNKLDATDTSRDNLNTLQGDNSSALRHPSGLNNQSQHAPGPQTNADFTKNSQGTFHTANPNVGRPDTHPQQVVDSKKNISRQRSSGMYAGPYDTPPAQPGVNSTYSNTGAAASSSCMTGFPSSPTGPSTPTGAAIPPIHTPIGESGPAAETLKQLAANYQNHECKGAYGAYGPDGYPESLGRRPGYPNYNMQGYMGGPQNGGYPYPHPMAGRMPYPQNQMGTHMTRASMGAQGPRIQGHSPHSLSSQSPEAMKPTGPYPANKPLSHYGQNASGATSGSPSSLQQLQDQVKTQFGPSPHGPQMNMPDGQQMQFSQSQQMHMSPSMSMSQTQRMHFQASGNGMSMAQQQSFNMSYHGANPGHRPMAPHTQNEYMKMYQEKMMREQEMRRMQQMSGGHATHPSSSGGAHPPPEYPANRGSNPNPLQTMQSMVDQTNRGSTESRSGMFPVDGVKQESMPRHSMASSTSLPQPRTSPAQPPPTSQATPSFSAQSTPTPTATTSANTTLNSTTTTDVKSDSSNYTSAIMRGQRPPNVNVGPDGLNISQPRVPGWPRPMIAGQGQGGTMMGHMGHSGGPAMYGGGYGNETGMSMHPRMQMSQQQQQALHMQRTMAGGAMPTARPHAGMPPQGHPASMGMQHGGMAHSQAAMMMGQQQQLHMQNGHTMAAMSQASAMGVSRTAHHPSPAYPNPHGGPASTQGNPNYALEFLDNPQAANNPDFFDPVTANNPPSEFNFIDDFLSGK